MNDPQELRGFIGELKDRSLIHDFNISFEAATKLKDDIDKNLVTPICGENGDLSTGILKDFDNNASAFEGAMKGATGTQVKNYVDAVKQLIIGHVMGLRKMAEEAKTALQLTVNAEADNAAAIATSADETATTAKAAIADAQNIATKLELDTYNQYTGSTSTEPTFTSGGGSSTGSAGNLGGSTTNVSISEQ